MSYANLKVGFLGLGLSNRSVIRYLSRYNCTFTLRADTPSDIPSGFDKAFFKDRMLESLSEDVIFISPSVRRDRPELAPLIKSGIPLSSDCELYYRLHGSPEYAVTGSDGKSTTAYLISEVLNRSGKAAAPAANFGLPLMDLYGTDVIAVAELSSFQLTYAVPKVKRAVITNISQNHLDWHKSLDEYISVKLSLGKEADGAVIDADCKLLLENMNFTPFVAVSSTLSFSELKRSVRAENYITLKDGNISINSFPLFCLRHTAPRSRLVIKNMMLAAGATLGDVDCSVLLDTLNGFKGLPHRAQTVAKYRGLEFIDSSIDTTPSRTVATLSSYDRNTVVIIAGRGKGVDLSYLSDRLPSLTSGAVFMGEVGREVMNGIITPEYLKAYAENMNDAVTIAAKMLNDSGRVILSPAGTSFDAYDSYAMRGEDFARCAKKYIKSKDF